MTPNLDFKVTPLFDVELTERVKVKGADLVTIKYQWGLTHALLKNFE